MEGVIFWLEAGDAQDTRKKDQIWRGWTWVDPWACSTCEMSVLAEVSEWDITASEYLNLLHGVAGIEIIMVVM